MSEIHPPQPRLPPPTVRLLGQRTYTPTWQAMREFTDYRRHTPQADELWLLQHDPVFTQGSNGRPEHLLMPGDIPVVQSDRGGQITYHGPGQLMLYVLADIKRLGLGVRSLVTALERAMISTLGIYGIHARARPDAPGVYIGTDKIGSIGLRIRHGFSFHGLALNVDMDLQPFNCINPCGFEGLRMTQMSALAGAVDADQVGTQLIAGLCDELGYAPMVSANTYYQLPFARADRDDINPAQAKLAAQN